MIEPYGYIYKTTIKTSKGVFYYWGQRLIKQDMENVSYIYCGSGRIIKDYVRKHGYIHTRLKEKDLIELNIKKEILEYCYGTKEDLNGMEKKYIEPHLGKDYCWNLISGGKNVKFTNDLRKRLSESHKGLKWSEKRRAAECKRKELNLPHGNKGKTRTLEQRKRISEAHKGLTSANKGNKYSDELKKRLSEIRLNNIKICKYINIRCIETMECFKNIHDLKINHPEFHVEYLLKRIKCNKTYKGLHWVYDINPEYSA